MAIFVENVGWLVKQVIDQQTVGNINNGVCWCFNKLFLLDSACVHDYAGQNKAIAVSSSGDHMIRNLT